MVTGLKRHTHFLSSLRAVAVLAAFARPAAAQASRATLAETLDWLKVQIDEHGGYDYQGHPLQMYTHWKLVQSEGCNLVLEHHVMALNVSEGGGRSTSTDVLMLNLGLLTSASVEVDGPSGRDPGVMLRSSHSGAITRTSQKDGTIHHDGYWIALRGNDLALRAATAFQHAIHLCGGKIAKEPF